MRSDPSKISMVTSASQGIGAGIAAELRRPGYGVVATLRSIRASDHHDLLTVQGDITDAETAPRPVEQALERFAAALAALTKGGPDVVTRAAPPSRRHAASVSTPSRA
jgi:NAD(P)-dependent dehydrogenase (short-subunit alcohol dehydrogenase family)